MALAQANRKLRVLSARNMDETIMSNDIRTNANQGGVGSGRGGYINFQEFGDRQSTDMSKSKSSIFA